MWTGFATRLHTHNVGSVTDNQRTSRAVQGIYPEQRPCLPCFGNSTHANRSSFLLVFFQGLVAWGRCARQFIARSRIAFWWVHHVDGSDCTQCQNQATQNLQRKLKRKVHGLQEEDFQRTQPHSAQTEAGNYQTVNHTFFGGVEPFHRSSTGAGIYEANAVTNQQREDDDKHHGLMGKEAAQECAAANHQDTSENHFCWANFVLQGAGNNNDKC